MFHLHARPHAARLQEPIAISSLPVLQAPKVTRRPISQLQPSPEPLIEKPIVLPTIQEKPKEILSEIPKSQVVDVIVDLPKEKTERSKPKKDLLKSPEQVNHKIRIYILQFDDASEALVKKHFSKYSWAFPQKLNQDTMQLGLQENIMYRTELLKMKDEWTSLDQVGTLSYKAQNKINLARLDKNFKYIAKQDAVFFCTKFVSVHVAQNQHPNFSKIWNDVIRDQCAIQSTKTALQNFWMASPHAMECQCHFFQDLWSVLLKHPLLLTDAKQKGHHSRESILQNNGHPFYVHTPFILERVPRNQFQDQNFTVLDLR